jgi:hypothetical protein
MPMSEQTTPTDEPSNLHYLAILLGGLLVGGGIIGLWYSFGDPSTPLNLNFTHIGWSALDNISLLPASNYSIVMVAAGVALMVFMNAGAWRYTGGY